MSDRAACYIERAGSGDMILRVRYCDPRGSREWLAPGGLRQGPAVHDNMRAAASWVHEQVTSASSRLPLDVVLDLDGGVCGWLTAPASDEKTVRSTLVAAKAGVGSSGEEREGTPASWLEHGDLGTDVSIQALTDSAAHANGSSPVVTRQRLAVMCVPDLAARVLLDELDRLGTEVDRVMSLWHAIGAWEPGRHGEVFDRGGAGAQVVASSEPVSAVLIVEESGKAAWSWVRDGRLLAGGSLRLKRVVSKVSEDEPAEPVEAEPASGALRRIGARKNEPAQVLEASVSDVGRIVSEWLAWSTQLGIAPGRLVCLGPWSITSTGLGSDLPNVSGIAAVGAAIGRAWPGTNVSAKVDEDVVASTLARLVRGPEGLAAPAANEPSTTTDMVELSRRPGRTNRVLYRWLTMALCAGAVVFVAAGIRLGQSVGGLNKQADEMVTKRNEALAKVSDLVKMPADEQDPLGVLGSRLARIKKDRDAVKPDEPLLAEINRLMEALDGLPDAQLQSLSLSSMRDGLEIGRLVFKIENGKENAAGAYFKDRVATIPPVGKRWIAWDVRIPIATADREEYALVGRWADRPAVISTPSVPKPVAKPKDVAPAEGEAPADAKPPEAKPAETKPAEPKSAEPKPAGTVPGKETKITKPIVPPVEALKKPDGDKPAEAKP